MSLLNIKEYRGTFARDSLPNTPIDGEAGIVNLDNMAGMGTHWVCYYIGPKYAEYFDSYGLPIPNEILRYLKRSKKRVIGSTNEIQHLESIYCGYYCLYYILARVVDQIDPYDIVYKFDNTNTKLNDRLVMKLLKRYY